MASSLDTLSRSYQGSRLTMDRLAEIFGEPTFGPLTRAATMWGEGFLFAGCTIAAHFIAENVQQAEAGTEK